MIEISFYGNLYIEMYFSSLRGVFVFHTVFCLALSLLFLYKSCQKLPFFTLKVLKSVSNSYMARI